MPYVVIEDCIKCKYTDCVTTCPVSCFYEGENMLVINPDECIDCATCEANCPVHAIVSDDDPRAAEWRTVNKQYAAIWPRLAERLPPPEDAKQWEGVPNKFRGFFSALPGGPGLRLGGT